MRNLETERLLLRPTAAAEYEEIYRILVEEIEGEAFTREAYEPERLFDLGLEQQSLGVYFGRPSIFLKGESRYIGNCLVMPRLCTSEELDLRPAPGHASNSIEAEIGWAISDRYRGYGYATEAAGALIDYALGDLDLPRVVAFTDAENLASIRVMEKVGMRVGRPAGSGTVVGVRSK